NIIADQIAVDRPKVKQVDEQKSSQAISQMNTPFYPNTQKVAVLIGNNFNGAEVKNVLDKLEQNGVFIELIGEKLGTVTGDDCSSLNIDYTFASKYSVLYDSLFIVGSKADNRTDCNQNIGEWLQSEYKHCKPIGVATSASSYMHTTDHNNLAGGVFAEN